ncbi:hypothetical protein LIZ91_06030 [Enterococcus avium]|uniref:hypothetical protein n=1 Tax=Enterococcus avium TaxID=33945 RepID=UPI001D0770FD|nr:hypothetical protein [Enterococcus avium]MCB6916141.1 hypothetical protein [Enterococcus avium]MCQ4959999.1 hypothetical protein [Enterococcus avium]
MSEERFEVGAYYTDLDYLTAKDVERRDVLSSHKRKVEADEALFVLLKQMDAPHYSNYYDRVCVEPVK